MPITIKPASTDDERSPSADQLLVTGDIHDTLIIPAPSPDDVGGHTLSHVYYVAVSDGSLIRATNDPERPNFSVVLKGSSPAEASEDGLSLSVAGPIAWVALSSNSGGHAISDAAIDAAIAAAPAPQSIEFSAEELAAMPVGHLARTLSDMLFSDPDCEFHTTQQIRGEINRRGLSEEDLELAFAAETATIN